MVTITEQHIKRLIEIESQVHYSLPPDIPRRPFVVIERKSPVLISAPHGAISLRNDQKQLWHEEDEYTAGMALLLGELCQASVIASTWKTIDSDPNYHFELRSPYKQEIRRLVKSKDIYWVIDLHGAGLNSTTLGKDKLIDIGTRKDEKSFNPETVKLFKDLLINNLRKNYISEDEFSAYATKTRMSITAFCHQTLGIDAMQIEMKPHVRVPMRRVDSSAYHSGEHFDPEPTKVIGMIQALVDLIGYLQQNYSVHHP